MKPTLTKVALINIGFIMGTIVWACFSGALVFLIVQSIIKGGPLVGLLFFLLIFSGGGLVLLKYSANPYRKAYVSLFKYLKNNQLANALEVINGGNFGLFPLYYYEMIVPLAKASSDTSVEIAALEKMRLCSLDGHKKRVYYQRLGELYISLKEYKKAIEVYEGGIPLTLQELIKVYHQCRCFDKLLRMAHDIAWHNINQEGKLSQIAEELIADIENKIQDISSRVEQFIQEGDIDLACSIYHYQKRYTLSAPLRRRQGKYREAAEDYKYCGNYKMEAEMHELRKDYKSAGEAYYKMELFEKASACFARASLERN